jgi:hypothetical protein
LALVIAAVLALPASNDVTGHLPVPIIHIGEQAIFWFTAGALTFPHEGSSEARCEARRWVSERERDDFESGEMPFAHVRVGGHAFDTAATRVVRTV